MAKTDTKIIHNRPILFFDGVCNLCNGFIDFLVSRDKEQLHFHFAPLQGRTAAEFLRPEEREGLATVVYWDRGKILVESAAAISVITALGGIWKLSKILLLIPSPLRDFVYRAVAKNRYKLFGRRDSCRLPSAQERKYFLD